MTRERLLVPMHAAILVVTAVVVAVTYDVHAWPSVTTCVLLITALFLGRSWETWLGPIAVTASSPATLMAVVLLGPAPVGVAVGTVAAIVSLHQRRSKAYVLVNITIASGHSVVSALTFRLLTGGALRAGPALAEATLAAGMVMLATNIALVLPSTWVERVPVRKALREAVVPVIPWELACVGLATGAALAYPALGDAAVAGLCVVVGLQVLVLELLGRGQRSARELVGVLAERDRLATVAVTASERERRKMAAALHDDALQTLLAAHDDLLEGLQGDRERVQRAYSSISLAMSSLRSLLARLGPADVDAPLMGDVLAAAARRARERSGLAVEVYCRPELLDLRDAEAAATIRELVLNVERHAMASRMRISVSGTEAGVLVEVADDGCGCVEPTLADLVDNGHLGLALIARRARERSGWFRLQPAPGGGTLARALLPCRSSSCDRRCQAPPDEATAF